MSHTYKRNMLSEVIARIDFAAPLENLASHLPEAISISALKRFPLSEPRKLLGDHLTITKDTFERTREETTEWRYHSADRTRFASISAQALLVVDKSYASFERFQDDLLAITAALLEAHPTLTAQRFGLRYINTLTAGEGGLPAQPQSSIDWATFVHDGLLCRFRSIEDRARISRSFHDLQFNFGDIHLKFQFGEFNADYPAPIARPQFILDLDASVHGLIPGHAVKDLLGSAHTTIQSYFEMSITDSLREALNA